MAEAEENYAGVWDGRLGFGKKSVIVVIDLLQGYTTEGSPLYAPGVVDCVKQVPEVLDLAREKGVSIIHESVLVTVLAGLLNSALKWLPRKVRPSS